jgi:hypothetical protein
LPRAAISGLWDTARTRIYKGGTAILLVMLTESGALAFLRDPLDTLFNTTAAIEHVLNPTSELGLFEEPITTYATSYFLIARLAARRMLANKSGVIMTATTQHSRVGIPLSGGYGPAMAAEEASLDCYPPSSHPRAFAWSVCDHRPYPRQARSRKPLRLAPRCRE